jgi:hypothetical protein
MSALLCPLPYMGQFERMTKQHDVIATIRTRVELLEVVLFQDLELEETGQAKGGSERRSYPEVYHERTTSKSS